MESLAAVTGGISITTDLHPSGFLPRFLLLTSVGRRDSTVQYSTVQKLECLSTSARVSFTWLCISCVFCFRRDVWGQASELALADWASVFFLPPATAPSWLVWQDKESRWFEPSGKSCSYVLSFAAVPPISLPFCEP